MRPVTSSDVASILEIQMLKARYFRCMDGKDWVGLRALFTPDATLFFPEVQPAPVEIAQAMEFIMAGMAGVTSIHHGHMPEIDILSPHSARGVWSMEDWVRWSPDQPSPHGFKALHGLGEYHEDYARPADRWLIHRLELKRLWMETETA